MAKIFTKNTWTDEVLSGAEAYEVVKAGGGAITNVSELADAEINLKTPVAVAGTALDAAKMNNLENGIDELDTQINAGHNIPNVAPGASGNILKSDGTDWKSEALTSSGSSPAFVRCSVVNGDANPVLDYMAQTKIYAFPFGGGNTYPQWDGSAFVAQVFAALELALNAAHTSGSNYDKYLWNDGGTVRVVSGPAWVSSTSRGSGAGTAETEIVNGVNVNKVAMTVRNGGTTYTMPARYGTLIGTFMASANGETESSKKKRLLTNRYNKIATPLNSYDITNSWTSSSISTRELRSGSTYGVSRVGVISDGLSQIHLSAVLFCGATGTMLFSTGIGINNTTDISTINCSSYGIQSAAAANPIAFYDGVAPLGYNFFAHLEQQDIAALGTFFGNKKIGLSGWIMA
jgi:hypothetical protein